MSDEAKDLAKLLDYGTFASTLADLEPQNMTDEDRDRLREMFHFISGYVAERKQRDAEIAGLRAENERLRVLLNEIRERDYGACKDAIGLPLMEKIAKELDGNALRGSKREDGT